MLKNLLLIILGIISLIAILNWLHIIGPRPQNLSKPECDDSKRYDDDSVRKPGGGTPITNAYADTLADHFKTKYLDSVHIEKSYFSKKAIDHLFAKHPTANAIGCTYAIENDSLKIIINAYRIAQTEIDIEPSLDSTYYIAKAVCPPTCPPAPK